MIINIASENVVKVNATRVVIDKIFKDSKVHSVAVKANIPVQPIGDDETQLGAYRRAIAAMEYHPCDLGIGLEGGLRRTLQGWAVCSWAAVIDASGNLGLGCSGIIPLPKLVAQRVLGGEELGEVMDDLTNDTRTHQKIGASGILTRSLVDRQKVFEDALICALSPWLVQEYHKIDSIVSQLIVQLRKEHD